ncbi:MAG: hypothetical protein KKB31_01445 [Nanoarchaeota archaeon]|nr:hypothetical protein [Nanoarchaeota archaeon]
MEKKSWIFLIVVVVLVALVIIFWDGFIVEKNQVVEYDYCETVDDCVYVINIGSCCNCPMPINRDVAGLEENYVVYVEGEDYSLYEKEEDCNRVNCEVGCASLGVLGCVDNKCVLLGGVN